MARAKLKAVDNGEAFYTLDFWLIVVIHTEIGIIRSSSNSGLVYVSLSHKCCWKNKYISSQSG